MRTRFSILVFLYSSFTFAKHVEIDIKKLDYKKPSNQGIVGDLKFRRVNLSWDGINIKVLNQNKIFDSKIHYKPTHLRFLSSPLEMGFNLEKDNGLKNVRELDISESKFIINPQFFSFGGEGFQIIDDKSQSRLKLQNFNFFCEGLNKFDLTTADGIIGACLSEFYLSGLGDTQLADAEVEYIDESVENPIIFRGRLDEIELKDREIKANFASNHLEVKPFRIASDSVEASCYKNEEIIDLNQNEELVKDCLDNLKIGKTNLRVFNTEEKSQFDVNSKSFEVTNQRLLLDTFKTSIEDVKKKTVLNQLKVECLKTDENNLGQLQMVLKDCFKDGSLSIGPIDSITYRANTENFEVNGYFTPEDGPSRDPKYEKSRVRGLKFTVQDNKMDITARIKFIREFNVRVNADINYKVDEDKIVLNINKVRFPFNIKGRWLLMSLLNKFLVVDFISYGRNKIEIQL